MPDQPATAASDPLVWTIDMALLVDLPCPVCSRTERCRCYVPKGDRTAQRAAYIAARVRERGSPMPPSDPCATAAGRGRRFKTKEAADAYVAHLKEPPTVMPPSDTAAPLSVPSFDNQGEAHVGHGLDCVLMQITGPAAGSIVLHAVDAHELGRLLIEQARHARALTGGRLPPPPC